jgi:hypothetical protein
MALLADGSWVVCCYNQLQALGSFRVIEMQITSSKQSYSGCSPQWFAFFCLALIAFLGAAQAVHSHPGLLNGTADHCELCMALHTTPSVGQAVQLSFSFQTTAYLRDWENPGNASRAALFVLFSRPPPSLA